MGVARPGDAGYGSALYANQGATQQQRTAAGVPGSPNNGAVPAYSPGTTHTIENNKFKANHPAPTSMGIVGGPPPGGAPAPAPGPSAPPIPGLLSGPGSYEEWAARNSAAFDAPSATETAFNQFGSDPFKNESFSEQLYREGIGQLDPFYDHAERKGTAAINDAMAARGGFNSGAAIQKIGDLSANLRGQQAVQMQSRAGQADRERTSRYGQGMGFAGDRDSAFTNRLGAGAALHRDQQTFAERRLGDSFDRSRGLANDKAGLTADAHSDAANLFGESEKEAIAAELKKAGIDPTGNMVNDLMKLIEIGGKIAAK
jgi:hypothetical protein